MELKELRSTLEILREFEVLEYVDKDLRITFGGQQTSLVDKLAEDLDLLAEEPSNILEHPDLYSDGHVPSLDAEQTLVL